MTKLLREDGIMGVAVHGFRSSFTMDRRQMRTPHFDGLGSDMGFPGGEIGMLVVETVVRIRCEHAGDKLIKAIARDLRLSRKVVRKAIRAPEGACDYHRSVQPLPRIGSFQKRPDTLLTENEARHRRDRLRMIRIHDLLRCEGFEGSYDAVRRYAWRWSDARRKDPGDGKPAFIPLLFKPGGAYQFDWSHEDVEIAGKPMRVKAAHMRLCASRAVYVRAYVDGGRDRQRGSQLSGDRRCAPPVRLAARAGLRATMAAHCVQFPDFQHRRPSAQSRSPVRRGRRLAFVPGL